MAAKDKKALESRRSPLANAKEFSAKSQERFFPAIKTSSCCNLIRNAFLRKKDACKYRSSAIKIFSREDAEQSLFIAE
jgi:hypothetical protein